jgi:hypothetical protein
MSTHYQPLPDAWVRRLFERFAELYGAQKVAAMWGDVGTDRLVPVWAETLGKFDAATLAAAVKAMPEREAMWPPTLPEFVALCREQQVRPEHRRALPVPKRSDAEIAAGAEQMAKIRAMLAGATKRVPHE